MTTFVIVSFGKDYTYLKNALVRSIHENMPDAKIKDIEVNYKPLNSFQANNYKLKLWCDNVDGNTVFIDADTIVLSDISEVFNLPNDLIYTERLYNTKIPFNSGVVFVKESGLNILQEWLKFDEMLFKNKAMHLKWRSKYFGMNQASFGCMIETMPELNIGTVPSCVYNSCDHYDWEKLSEMAKIVHVKSLLRTSIKHRMNKYPLIENRIKKYYL